MTILTLNLDAQGELSKLASNIKLARKRRKITLDDMSERCGTSVSTLVRIESGDPNVAFGTVLQVLSVLGLLQGISEIALPENDVAQVLEEVRSLRLKKIRSKKKRFNNDDLNF